MVSTVQGRVFGVVDLLISGVIAMSLAQKPGMAFEKLRDELLHVIRSSMVHVRECAPPADKRLQPMLDMCLPDHAEAKLLLRAG